jgi:hypothetical protein
LDQEFQQRWRAQLAYFVMMQMRSMASPPPKFLISTSRISIANI